MGSGASWGSSGTSRNSSGRNGNCARTRSSSPSPARSSSGCSRRPPRTARGLTSRARPTPAEATGGDYFDYLPMLHGRVGLVVGDVTGHGVGPALLMAETRAYLRVLAGRREEPGEILTRANGILAEDMGVGDGSSPCFLGRLDPATREFLLRPARGIPRATVLAPDGAVKARLKRTGIPLGLRSETVLRGCPGGDAGGGRFGPAAYGRHRGGRQPGRGACSARSARWRWCARAGPEPARAIVEALYRAAREFSCGGEQDDTSRPSW